MSRLSLCRHGVLGEGGSGALSLVIDAQVLDLKRVAVLGEGAAVCAALRGHRSLEPKRAVVHILRFQLRITGALLPVVVGRVGPWTAATCGALQTIVDPSLICWVLLVLHEEHVCRVFKLTEVGPARREPLREELGLVLVQRAVVVSAFRRSDVVTSFAVLR